MKTIILFITVTATAFGLMSLQKGENKTTFIDRYYQIRDSYKDAGKTAHGLYAGSTHQLDEYMKRYYSYRDSYTKTKNMAEFYAASNYSLEEFDKRYNEIKKVYPYDKDLYGYYGMTKWNLKDFNTRYNEIRAAQPKMDRAFGAYSASYHKLDEFVKRFHAIKASYANLGEEIYGAYAGSDQMMLDSKSKPVTAGEENKNEKKEMKKEGMQEKK